jgi:hypothetical protein
MWARPQGDVRAKEFEANDRLERYMYICEREGVETEATMKGN